MAPLLPGLSDHPSSIERVVVAARDAGACGIWANVLNLRPGTREHFLACLERDWPEERARYEKLYGDRSYLPREHIATVTRYVASLAREHAATGPPPLRPRPIPTQLTLV